MSQTPSWLKETDEVAVTKAVVENSAVQSTVKTVASDSAVQKAVYQAATGQDEVDIESKGEKSSTWEEDEPEDLDIPPEELALMKKYSIALRLFFMAISILMATAACLKLENASISTAFIALYVFAFSILICCFEVALKTIAQWISMNFGFLYTLSGRVLFLTFVAVMCFNLGLFGQVVMGLTFAGLLFNLYVLIMFPKFSRWQRTAHYNCASA